MKDLLKFEFYKLKKQKSFYICTAVILAMSFLGALLTKLLADNNAGLNTVVLSGQSTMLSAISSSNFTMICSIFIALFVCADHSEQTIKNIYSRGFSKGTVYFAKYTVGVVATATMFVLTLLFSFAIGSVMFVNKTAESGNIFGFIIGQLILCIAYTSFVFAISLSLKKVGSSIALAILGPMLVSMLLSLADAFLKIDKFKISSYWIEGFVSDLSIVSTKPSRLAVCIILSAIYAIVFAATGFFINKKQEN